MKSLLFIFCFFSIFDQDALAQANIATASNKQQENGNDYPDFDQTLLLETKSDTTANVSFGDLDGDGHLDILLVKGRHWPIIDRVLLGDGSGGIRKSYSLGEIADRSYTGGLSDFNGDGFLDIAISNDAPDRKLIYLNDGKGNFTIGSEFGRPEWPTRNLSIADINKDGLPDLILANRGNASTSNYICLNQGNGKFNSSPIAFARYRATTITPADFNKDGFVDLVVPHRDGGQSYLYPGSSDMVFSDEHRIPFGPADASIRAAAVADFNGDSLPDVVTIDEFKGVNLYFGQKNNNFSAGISLADSNLTPYALAIADMNRDGRMDVIVGHKQAQSKVFFNDGTGLHFKGISFGDSKGDVYGFAIADFNEDGIPDIATARSEATNILYFGHVKSKTK
ncbi:VCBS repeat-containing protein [Dyadobacter sp. CY323]|uniref:FG-GAP repeat domain-containing protein n=1 Tax=Dyadobacter sp. CY323 TaxID=2907302 RepID=UPI001F43212E|nr:VCBS repeat-containing protein [Dyadobacter sp. CY323]MCE6989551.1 VCBS repeat-containing protein [Dyadobacter sp. CY323]